jgi:hypothetical protein
MKKYSLQGAFVVIIVFIIINNLTFFPKNILSWDVFGYYLYLPLKFIYNDLSIHDLSKIESVIAHYQNTSNFYQGMVLPDGSYVMKYSMGMSFMYAPFFFIAHIIAKVFGYTADGFSAPYQYSIFVGSILYTLLGLWALSKALLHFFDKTITAVVLLLLVFSTNYIVHITMYGQNAMSHNYLFMTYAFIIWLTILWHQSHKLKYMIWLGIFCGISILSRPSEIVCLLIPLLWGIKDLSSFKEKMQLLLKYKGQLILFTLIILLFGLCQSVYWKIHTGKFLFYSYGANPGEGFEFFHPYILEVLFSFRKGWLIYTPVMLLSIAGFYFIYKYNRAVFFTVLVFFMVNLYIVSSWSCWWYAQTFSQRSLIPSYPVMAIGLGYFLMWAMQQAKAIKMVFIILITCLLLLNIFQVIQFHNGIIDGDRMTRAYYFKVFGKLNARPEDKNLLLVNRTFYGDERFDDQPAYSGRLLKKLDFESSDKKDAARFYSGTYSFKLNELTPASDTIKATYSEITQKDHAWLKITANVYPTKDTAGNPFSLVVHFTHNGYPYKYITYDSKKMNLEPNKWNSITFYYLTPEVRRKSNELKVYFTTKKNADAYIDDLQVEVYEKKD